MRKRYVSGPQRLVLDGRQIEPLSEFEADLDASQEAFLIEAGAVRVLPPVVPVKPKREVIDNG